MSGSVIFSKRDSYPYFLRYNKYMAARMTSTATSVSVTASAMVDDSSAAPMTKQIDTDDDYGQC